MRETIDFGIDLGTTNSAIAVMTPDGEPEIVRNNKRRELTPSAVYVDAEGRLYVGDVARNRVDRNPLDVATEFKLRMGARDAAQTFAASGRTMSPEDLSAEVLKSLRRDVGRELDEQLSATVITVPAAFELDQNNATVRAARLAGLTSITLIQEPTAAAWAYGHRSRGDKGFWLVYDFGGGTFDAAIVQVEDGEFVVVNHDGDNFLGGKLIDWSLVEHVLIPALTQQHDGFAGISRNEPRWSVTVAKLKLAAEQAKIELTDSESFEVDVELDGDEGRVDFTCQINRDDVHRALAPLYTRSLNHCKKALADEGLSPGDLDKVLLVGGTTLIPVLRAKLADPREGLGVPLDFSLDPVTVVARGAAIFASTLRAPRELTLPDGPGEVAVHLEFEPVGTGNDPFVAGRLHAAGITDWTGHTIEFANDDGRPPWRSGLIKVDASGTFATRLHATEDTVSTFTLEVSTPQGATLAVTPPSLTFRHELGVVGSGTGAAHSLGVTLEDNQVLWLIAKGAKLPVNSGRALLRTTVEINRAAGTGFLRVPIVHGERRRADRNTTVGALELRPEDVRFDLRAGSEVEVMLCMDLSQQVEATAYIPTLDKEFPIAVELGRESQGGAGLQQEAIEVAERYDELRKRARILDSPAAAALLSQVEEEGAITDIDGLAAAFQADPDAEQSARSRIRDVQALLDDVEEKLEVPALADDFRTLLGVARELIDAAGDAHERGALDAADKAGTEAIERGDHTVLAHQKRLLGEVVRRHLDRVGRLDQVHFTAMEAKLADNPDPAVQELLRRGRGAMQRGDRTELRAVLRQLDRRRLKRPEDDDGTDPTSTVLPHKS